MEKFLDGGIREKNSFFRTQQSFYPQKSPVDGGGSDPPCVYLPAPAGAGRRFQDLQHLP
jgi:hypothetical protein